jgi:hypothetical protein
MPSFADNHRLHDTIDPRMIHRVMIDPMIARQPVCPTTVCPIDGEIALTRPPEFTLICALCFEPVLLETCKADEQGRAVHEDCYATKIKFNKTPLPPYPSSDSDSI